MSSNLGSSIWECLWFALAYCDLGRSSAQFSEEYNYICRAGHRPVNPTVQGCFH